MPKTYNKRSAQGTQLYSLLPLPPAAFLVKHEPTAHKLCPRTLASSGWSHPTEYRSNSLALGTAAQAGCQPAERTVMPLSPDGDGLTQHGFCCAGSARAGHVGGCFHREPFRIPRSPWRCQSAFETLPGAGFSVASAGVLCLLSWFLARKWRTVAVIKLISPCL